MLTALILIAFAGAVLVLILLAVVVAATRQEPRGVELNIMAPSVIAAMVRRALGVYVRRPEPLADSTDRQEEFWPDTRSSTAWVKTTLPTDQGGENDCRHTQSSR